MHLLLLLAFATLLLFLPLFQLMNYGVIFYANALDESNYLQYHHSLLAAQLMVRPIQNVVNFLHERGLSGGMIHLLFDSVFPILNIWVFALIFKKARLFSGREIYFALALFVLPLLFEPFNPLIDFLHANNIKSGWLYWITIPDAKFPPLLRTPEPQFSWLLVSFTVFLSLKVRSAWPLCIVLPLLYTFVAVPLAFITGTLLGLEITRRYPRVRRFVPLFVFIALSLALRLYFQNFVREEAKGNIVITYLPLFSFTGSLSLLFYFILRERVEDPLRELLWVISLAPWVAANTQVISGFVTAPSNFEQYFGAVSVSLLALISLYRCVSMQIPFLIAVSGVFVLFCLGVLKEHLDLMRFLSPSPGLLEALHEDASKVVINHPKISVLYNQIYPRQNPTFLSYSKMYWGEAQKAFPQYMCFKKEVANDPKLSTAFAATLMRMDAAFSYETEDDPLITIFRKTFDRPKLDVTKVPEGCEKLDLKYFLIKDE